MLHHVLLALCNRGVPRDRRRRSAAVGRAPALELLARLRPRRIDAEDRAPFRHLLLYEILERRLLERLLRDLLGDVLGDHRNALVVAHHDVAGIDRHLAARDRHVEVDGVMLDQVGRRRRGGVIGGKGHARDLRRVAQAAVGDEAGCAALPQARDQNPAGGGRRRGAAAVDHEDMAGRAFFHALALRMAAAFEHAQMIEVFPRRNVAQRIGRADHRRPPGVEAMDALDEGVAKATLEQNGGEGGGGHRRQLLPALGAQRHGDPFFRADVCALPPGCQFLPCRLVYERRAYAASFDGAATWRRLTSYSRDRFLKPTIGSWFPSSSSRTRATSPSGWPGLIRERSWKRPREPVF